jgi:glycosyltransferase involved in cell wall biosynthesis
MNGVFMTSVAGGDIHCFEMARAAESAGFTINFFGGHALQEVLATRQIPGMVTLTDRKKLRVVNTGGLTGQWALWYDYFTRFIGTLRALSQIQAEDMVYAVSDYWFDVLPAVISRARRKMMIWHMQAPSLRQIIFRTRADVDKSRVASLHYCLSQKLSLICFRFCRSKWVFYVHPAMRARLLALGFGPDECSYASFGMETDPPAPSQPKIYDAVWIGRVHRQKGIDDLLATLQHLSKTIEGFRAVLVGNLERELQPRLDSLGLAGSVELPGFVSDEEKFRLFQSSRIFLMPSRFEGSPRAVGEALLCGLQVVAYGLETYRPLFGDLVRYVPCFDGDAFKRAAEDEIRKARAGRCSLDKEKLNAFIKENSWQTVRSGFLQILRHWDHAPR